MSDEQKLDNAKKAAEETLKKFVATNATTNVNVLEEVKNLTDSLVMAQAVANNSTSTIAEVTAATTTLNTAVAIFKASIKTGTYSSGDDSDSDKDLSVGDITPPSGYTS